VRPLILALGSLVCLSTPVEQPAARFKARVEAVRVSALVTHRGRPVPGLAAEQFELRDNGIIQTIDRVDREDVPLDVVMVLDTSSSGRDGLGGGRGALSYSKSAARAALGELRPGDRAALLGFSHHVAVHSRLTNDRPALEHAIDSARPLGSTALCDAIVAALLSTDSEPGRRTLVLVYTDGIDNISWLTPKDTIAAAARTDAVVSVVMPRKDSRFRASSRLGEYRTMSRFLTDLTSTTGGSLIGSESDHLERTFAKIVREFAAGYQLTYYPRDVKGTGWHTLSVRLKDRHGTVQARRGYYAE
jgi:VWFA-related protein